MIVEVKQKHINNGERCQPTSCAIAIATDEAIGRLVEISVSFRSINIESPEMNRTRYIIDPMLETWIRMWDRCLDVSPITIEYNDKDGSVSIIDDI